MKKQYTRFLIIFSLFVFGLVPCVSLFADHEPEHAENTFHEAQEEASDAAESLSDNMGKAAEEVETLARIRRAVIAEEKLSMAGRNIQIVLMENIVTLKGPVLNTDEKTTLERIAVAQAPGYTVINELQISPE